MQNNNIWGNTTPRSSYKPSDMFSSCAAVISNWRCFRWRLTGKDILFQKVHVLFQFSLCLLLVAKIEGTDWEEGLWNLSFSLFISSLLIFLIKFLVYKMSKEVKMLIIIFPEPNDCLLLRTNQLIIYYYKWNRNVVNAYIYCWNEQMFNIFA